MLGHERELILFRRISVTTVRLVLLGMGEDAHTARCSWNNLLRKNSVGVAMGDRLHEYSITLTVPAINAAANILFLVTGEK